MDAAAFRRKPVERASNDGRRTSTQAGDRLVRSGHLKAETRPASILLVILLLFAVASAGTLRIFVAGDHHGNKNGHKAVVATMLTQRPMASIFVNAGDWTNYGLESEWASVENIQAVLSDYVERVSVIGNHDLANPETYAAHCWVERQRSYYVSTTLAIHCLDYSLPIQDRVAWLLPRLIQDSAMGVRHIFVGQHVPIRTTCGGPGDVEAQQQLAPLFERFKVDLVFCGHTHAYEHDRVNGVDYWTVGTGGGVLTPRSALGPEQPWLVYRDIGRNSFMVVDICGDTLRAVGVHTDGSLFDPTEIVR